MKRRFLIGGAIAIVVIILITLLVAPQNNTNNSGSTYSRAPDGYGAWYALMTQKGTPIKRWQKPFTELANTEQQSPNTTLLRVYSSLTPPVLQKPEQAWVKKGNTLVILGIDQPVTQAPFTSWQNGSTGQIKIATKRRKTKARNTILGDEFGAVIWQKKLGKGEVIYATTPYLAANAYQEFPQNYQLLAQLVTQNSQTIFVDEYLHGHKDTEIIAAQYGESVISYLSQTPLLIAFVQGLIVLGIAIWANNRRWGQPENLKTPTVDNSQAYITALAGVLQKAHRTDFVVEAISREEQLQLQKALGLGTTLLDDQMLLAQWSEQTGKPAKELEQLLQQSSRQSRLSDHNLLIWLNKWQELTSHFI